jgi:hypothetical protein
MNCFNIREVEALLKGRFFPDLVSSHDYRTVLNETVLGLRFKTQALSPLTNSSLLFQTYGLTTAPETHTWAFAAARPIHRGSTYETLDPSLSGA